VIEAVLDKQLMIQVEDKVGSLAEVTSVISGSGINLLAVSAHAVDNRGTIMFVTEDNKQAKALLKTKKIDFREEEVVLVTVDNKPGALKTLTKKIADAGIDLNLLYGSVDKNSNLSRIVLVSENNDAVLMAVTLGIDDE